MKVIKKMKIVIRYIHNILQIEVKEFSNVSFHFRKENYLYELFVNRVILLFMNFLAVAPEQVFERCNKNPC